MLVNSNTMLVSIKTSSEPVLPTLVERALEAGERQASIIFGEW